MLSLEFLSEVLEQDRSAAASTVHEFDLDGRPFPFNQQPAIMGVVNLSPDSWYRESVCLSVDAAVARGRTLAAQGAAIIDIGAESSLAQAARIDEAGQASRLLPVVRGLRAAKILVSVETYEPGVARASLSAGANVLNLTGTDRTDDMYRLVAEHHAAVIICYVQGKNVREVGDFDPGADPTARPYEYFARETERASKLGVTRMFIDPGLGFYYRNLQDSALRVRHQMKVFLNTFRLRKLGWPTCHALPHAFEYFKEEVRCAEPFFAMLAALGRTDLFRTHEVSRVKAVIDTMQIV